MNKDWVAEGEVSFSVTYADEKLELTFPADCTIEDMIDKFYSFLWAMEYSPEVIAKYLPGVRE